MMEPERKWRNSGSPLSVSFDGLRGWTTRTGVPNPKAGLPQWTHRVVGEEALIIAVVAHVPAVPTNWWEALNQLPQLSHPPPQAGWGPGRPPTLKPANEIWASIPTHPHLFSALEEDFDASTICWKGPSTILLPLQEALNNYINLPKYGKKSLQIRDTWQIFQLHIFPLAQCTVLLGSYCYLECFL